MEVFCGLSKLMVKIFSTLVISLLILSAVLVVLSIPIFICFGIIYLLSYSPFIDFHYYSNFWHNVLFFAVLTFISSLVLSLCKYILIIVNRKKIAMVDDSEKRKIINGFRPTKLKEWIVYFIIFIAYMSIFVTYSERFDTNMIGVTLISVCYVVLFIFIDYLTDSVTEKKKFIKTT